jgi:UDP-2-acetamido-3-amino-2,3-dideoxy-glucuronate N-acetyltransferase
VTRKRAAWAHPSAVIDAGASIGPGTKVWHFCHVMKGARVGARCVLGQNVFIAGGAIVGDDCRVQNNVSIYDGVVLADEVFVGPSAVFTNVRTPRAAVNRKNAFVETRVGRGATIGANATIICGVEIGEYALVGAGAVVTKDVAAHAVVTGVPARRTGWACRCGELLSSAAGATPTTCPVCGRRPQITRWPTRAARAKPDAAVASRVRLASMKLPSPRRTRS